MDKLVSISEAAKMLGVSESTLRRWEKEGRLMADERTEGGQRRYKLSSIRPEWKQYHPTERKTIAYASVANDDQKANLARQKQVLELYCSSQGWTFEVLSDSGSGVNDHKKGLKTLIQSIVDDEVNRLVITHKDRLLKFGAELLFFLCEAKQVEVVIINQGEDTLAE
jgi:putative resolvase